MHSTENKADYVVTNSFVYEETCQFAHITLFNGWYFYLPDYGEPGYVYIARHQVISIRPELLLSVNGKNIFIA